MNACLPPWKGVYHWENQNIHQKLQHMFKPSLILLANTATPGQYTNSWPCPVSLRVITCGPVAFCSSPIESTLRKHSCNIIQIGRCTLGNAWAMKFANYLHLQMEQLLKHIRSLLEKTKKSQMTIEKIIQWNTIWNIFVAIK